MSAHQGGDLVDREGAPDSSLGLDPDAPDVATAVKNAKAGQVQYRADKAGIVQCTIGLASFAPEALCENLKALVEALNKAKPVSSKGIYLQKLSVSSTMGPGIRVDVASVTT